MSRGSVFDLAGKEDLITRLEAQSGADGLWEDPQAAQRLMRRLSEAQGQVANWHALDRDLADAEELAQLARDDGDLLPEVLAVAQELAARLDRMEFDLMLAGPHDGANSILSIHAGTGGVEAMDWANMMLRMYLRWAERRGFTAEIVDLLDGEETGIKSATVEIKGDHAYGYLRSEVGSHRLVRISPFGAAKRQTSFARVEVLPEVEDATEIVINDDDIRLDTYRASGAGGQHVNKTSSAIRITHLPTGIVVTCQNERSQGQNKETAFKILRAKLLERQEQERAKDQSDLKGEYITAGFGNRIRSYFLAPYTLVKDLRSGYETSNAQAVLDGELDDFINAYLRWTISDAPAAAGDEDAA